MPTSPFEDLSDCYEAMIDWPKRLAHEAPWYRRLFDELEAQSVLDTACGTGHHAALFHSWQMRVEGADISESMLARARRNFGEPPGLTWVRRGYADAPAAREPFDVALCVGNSLALAPDLGTARTAVTHMIQSVRPGGAVVLHVLNLWRLPDGPCQWQKCVHTQIAQRPVVIIKGVHRNGPSGYVDLVVSARDEAHAWRSDSVPFHGLEAATLEQWASEAGARAVDLYGGYRQEPYQRETSTDLIVVIRRA